MLTTFSRYVILLCATIQQASSIPNPDGSDWMHEVRQLQALEQQGDLVLARDVARRLVAEISKNDPNNTLLPQAVGKLASLEQDLGRYRDAEQLYERAVGLWQARQDVQPTGWQQN